MMTTGTTGREYGHLQRHVSLGVPDGRRGEEAESSSRLVAAPSSRSVLVADDDADVRAALRAALVQEGYRVTLASSGEEAVAAFEKERPVCVLLDVRFPDVDGFAVCERIRRSRLGAETAVVFVTGLRDVATFDRALAVGADDFLTKPLANDDLRACVEAARRLQHLRHRHPRQYWLLKQRQQDLLRAQLERERLTAFLVHDLKNPVASIDLHAQYALRRGDLPSDVRETLTHVRAEAHQLNRMILDMLDVSRARAGRLVARRAPVDLGALVSAVAQDLAMIARARSVEIATCADVGSIHADADLVYRTLVNLVENAIGHTPRGTTVRVTAQRRGDVVELRVADAGGGVPEHMLERIFEGFVQGADVGAARGVGHRGLGLAFCRHAVDAHGGEIWVESSGRGAVFCLTLPAGEPRPQD